jgi:Tol biopolymer transport system component
VRPDGTVKVLDFGLAKALGQGAPSATVDNTDHAALTVTSPALTQMGFILGTAAYMSPEQAAGKPVDRRSDIWAFGVVLLELLTGRRPFQGETVSHVIASVLKDTPDLSTLPADTPPSIRRLLRRCLEKDRQKRLDSAGAARQEIDDALSDASDVRAGAATDSASTVAVPSWTRALPWGVAAVLALVAVVMTALYVTQPGPDAPDLTTFELTPDLLSAVSRESISPDGRHLVYATRANGDEPRRYWIRSLGSLEARPIAGSEGFRNASAMGGLVRPIWSPDSTSLALVFGSALRRVDIVTGQVTPVIDYGDGGGGLLPGGWNEAGAILYGRRDGIWQVADTGGTPRQVTEMSLGQLRHVPAGFLPGGRRFLYRVVSPNGSEVRIGSIDAASGAQPASALVSSDGLPVYADGHLFFFRGENLMVQSFDADRGVLDGVPVQLLAAVAPPVTVNADVLVYRPASSDAGVQSELVHVDRAGAILDTIGAVASYQGVFAFNDGRRLVVSRKDGRGPFHVYVVERARQAFTRLTTGSDEDVAGVPSVDATVAYTPSSTGVAGHIYVRAANSVGDPTPLVTASYPAHANGWSPDGRFLLYDSHVPGRFQDLLVVGRDGGEPVALLETGADENLGQFSPNGRWIAYRYRSNEEGVPSEIYVRDFVADPMPAFGTRRVQISVNGGDSPRWSKDGKSLFYFEGTTLMQVSIDTETAASVEVGSPIRLFDIRLYAVFPYDVLPDGTFIMNRRVDAGPVQATPLRVVVNWTALLRR